MARSVALEGVAEQRGVFAVGGLCLVGGVLAFGGLDRGAGFARVEVAADGAAGQVVDDAGGVGVDVFDRLVFL